MVSGLKVKLTRRSSVNFKFSPFKNEESKVIWKFIHNKDDEEFSRFFELVPEPVGWQTQG